MFYLEKSRKRLLFWIDFGLLTRKPILGFTLLALLVSGCDFINQVGNLGSNIGDMIGRGVEGG
jgi:hypothetical protein